MSSDVQNSINIFMLAYWVVLLKWLPSLQLQLVLFLLLSFFFLIPTLFYPPLFFLSYFIFIFLHLLVLPLLDLFPSLLSFLLSFYIFVNIFFLLFSLSYSYFFFIHFLSLLLMLGIFYRGMINSIEIKIGMLSSNSGTDGFIHFALISSFSVALTQYTKGSLELEAYKVTDTPYMDICGR